MQTSVAISAQHVRGVLWKAEPVWRVTQGSRATRSATPMWAWVQYSDVSLPGYSDSDAEFKIANQLYAEFGPDRAGVSAAYVFSLIDFCPSCQGVLDRYQAQSGVLVVPWSAGGLEDGRDLRIRGNELRRQ